MRLVAYGANGTGVGHLVRLTAVMRHVRRLARSAQLEVDIIVVTSSEATMLLHEERLISFKIPSLRSIEDAGLGTWRYEEIVRSCAIATLERLAPDLIVVDSFPQGLFGELPGALQFSRTRALIARPSRAEYTRQPAYHDAISAYEHVLVPEIEPDRSGGQAFPTHAEYLGPIISCDPEEALPRAAARDALMLAEHDLAVYTSFGGGGDPMAAVLLQSICRVATGREDLKVFAGVGPLFRGRLPQLGTAMLLQATAVRTLLNGFDLAISAAGYNAFVELMHFGIPTAFIPLDRVADDQRARAARAAAAGAGALVEHDDLTEGIPQFLGRMSDPATRLAARGAARELVPVNAAARFAARLLDIMVE